MDLWTRWLGEAHACAQRAAVKVTVEMTGKANARARAKVGRSMRVGGSKRW